MTKTELIEVVSQRVDIPKTRTSVIVDAILDELKESLQRDERIEIRGFGTFTTRYYNSKNGRNPASGKKLTIEEKRSVHFKAGKELRERVDH